MSTVLVFIEYICGIFTNFWLSSIDFSVYINMGVWWENLLQ